MPTRRKTSSRRELTTPRGDRRFARRDAEGRFKESDDAGRSLAKDRKQRAKRRAPKGQGDKGDRT